MPARGCRASLGAFHMPGLEELVNCHRPFQIGLVVSPGMVWPMMLILGGLATISGVGCERSRPLESSWFGSYHAVSYSLRIPRFKVILRLSFQSSWKNMP